MLSTKRKLLGYLMYFLALIFLAVSISDIILRKSHGITYRYPWAGSLALLLGFVFLTLGGLLFFWKQERPWRNTVIIALGTIFITLTAGLFVTSDLKIKVSEELSSAPESSAHSIITWHDAETGETTYWHPYKTIFLKAQQEPIAKAERPETKEPEDTDASAETENPAEDIDTDGNPDASEPIDDPAGALIQQIKDAALADPALTTLEESISGSVRVPIVSTDKYWITKNILERYAQISRTDGLDRHIKIERIEIPAGTPEDFVAKATITERQSVLGMNGNPPVVEEKHFVYQIRAIKSGDCYAAYRFDETSNAAYGLEPLAEAEIQDFTSNGTYHFYMPADYAAAGYTGFNVVPSEIIQKLYASVFQTSYPNAVWFENNPQTGYQLSDTEYLLFYGVTADLGYLQFRHYSIATGYPVTINYYLMPFGTNEFIKQ